MSRWAKTKTKKKTSSSIIILFNPDPAPAHPWRKRPAQTGLPGPPPPPPQLRVAPAATTLPYTHPDPPRALAPRGPHEREADRSKYKKSNLGHRFRGISASPDFPKTFRGVRRDGARAGELSDCRRNRPDLTGHLSRAGGPECTVGHFTLRVCAAANTVLFLPSKRGETIDRKRGFCEEGGGGRERKKRRGRGFRYHNCRIQEDSLTDLVSSDLDFWIYFTLKGFWNCNWLDQKGSRTSLEPLIYLRETLDLASDCASFWSYIQRSPNVVAYPLAKDGLSLQYPVVMDVDNSGALVDGIHILKARFSGLVHIEGDSGIAIGWGRKEVEPRWSDWSYFRETLDLPSDCASLWSYIRRSPNAFAYPLAKDGLTLHSLVVMDLDRSSSNFLFAFRSGSRKVVFLHSESAVLHTFCCSFRGGLDGLRIWKLDFQVYFTLKEILELQLVGAERKSNLVGATGLALEKF
ncbi:hypothetical protein H6P81_018513 [Aristolochia fimbriata]|uniref:DUF1618 domain-containing protein n=1 Tax=Aristolochia fimbriata TaxID=158543 RepID=A0AAV7E391_ARIFI|nr:hypothetical protein H6P81_018513 [Aristolochia fimbriata]